MKVCLMTSTYPLSEQDTNVPWLAEMVRGLVRQGVEVHVFAPSYEGQPSHAVDGVAVYRFRYFCKRWEDLTHYQGAPNKLRNPLYLFVAFFYILLGLFHAVRFCRKNHFDVIVAHWPFPHGIWGHAASRLTRTPLVLNFHGAELLLCKKYFFVKYFLRHAIKHAQGLISNSSFTAKEVGRFTDKPVAVVPSGCTVRARPAAKDPDKPVKEILFVGRLIARKGVEYLLRALPLIDKEIPAHLHVIGSGDKDAELKALASRLGLGGKVTFHGKVPRAALEHHYASADVFVLPAIVDDRGDTEGLGTVLVEALSFKTPVVASNVGGIPDVIKDRETGLLVPEKDLPALAEAVVRVLRDPGLAGALAEHGLRHVNDYFDWDRIISEKHKVYRVAVDRFKGRRRDAHVRQEPVHAA